RDYLLWNRRALRPQQVNRCRAVAIVILEPNVVELIGGQLESAADLSSLQISPRADDLLIVDPEIHTVISLEIERVLAGRLRLDLSSPSDAEQIEVDRRIGASLTPLEVYGWIRSLKSRSPGQSLVVEVVAVKSRS